MWKKIVISFVTGFLIIGLILYTKRYSILVSCLQSSKSAHEMVIHEMLKRAKPIITQEIDLSFLEKAYLWTTGSRNENKRRSDAIDDVRTFVESAFQNQTLRFMDAHKLSSIHGFPIYGADIVLSWNHRNTEEVLVAFNINLIKRRVEEMRINRRCSFFEDLKSYVEKKAREK